MGFFDELSRVINLDEIKNKLKLILLGNDTIVLYGIKKLIDFSQEFVIVSIDGGQLKIEGNGITIAELKPNELVVKGGISGFAFV